MYMSVSAAISKHSLALLETHLTDVPIALHCSSCIKTHALKAIRGIVCHVQEFLHHFHLEQLAPTFQRPRYDNPARDQVVPTCNSNFCMLITCSRFLLPGLPANKPSSRSFLSRSNTTLDFPTILNGIKQLYDRLEGYLANAETYNQTWIVLYH